MSLTPKNLKGEKAKRIFLQKKEREYFLWSTFSFDLNCIKEENKKEKDIRLDEDELLRFSRFVSLHTQSTFHGRTVQRANEKLEKD